MKFSNKIMNSVQKTCGIINSIKNSDPFVVCAKYHNHLGIKRKDGGKIAEMDMGGGFSISAFELIIIAALIYFVAMLCSAVKKISLRLRYTKR